VISSDGLHDYVPESTIQGIAIADDPGTACRRLIDAAKDAASTDNITVIVAPRVIASLVPSCHLILEIFGTCRDGHSGLTRESAKFGIIP